MLPDLPVEILCTIVNCLPTASILRLRQVSKHLNQITYDRTIWAHAYRTSSLVRREGPFTWQTAKVLEANLIESTKLSLNWAPNPDAKPVQTQVINLDKHTESELLCGRWLLSRKNSTQISCYDLDQAAEPMAKEPYSIFYECRERDFEITDHSCEHPLLSERSGDEDHAAAFFLVTEFHAVISLLRRTLYKVTLTQGSYPTLHMVFQTDHTAAYPIRSELFVGPRFLAISFYGTEYFPRDTVFVDIVTYQQYHVPESASDTTKDICFFTIISSSTHVLFIQGYGPRFGDTVTHIQAYIIPPLQGTAPAALASMTLELSHELITETDLSSYVLLRDSKLHQPSGAIHITIFAADKGSEEHKFAVYVVFVKLNPIVQGVGSITLETNVNDLNRFMGRELSDVRLQPSLNGCTRGALVYLDNETSCIAALVVDDENAANTRAAVGYVQCSRDHEEDVWIYIRAFDGYRGRIITTQEICGENSLIVDDFV
ncbi:hypothetical protein BJ138DRAFT_1148243 [Hygrophoropsis aurantiaca]|uniref:Uncharacterized protein n=1 Tax=Hygrophoropsis aurantiaca TaxID=72124 RepID=A0ACB8AIF1_9AGAM|nr:hypothetical protein BJ138DRAFT_1148243 [Hygrophoropsis aurantiaca]